MLNIKDVRKKVMTIGNKLRKSGSSLRESLKLAWYFVKKKSICINVKGTAFGKRQRALAHLVNYSKNIIKIYLVREPRNSFDKDAVAVVVRVLGRGSYKMGYISKNIAAAVSILLDKKYSISTAFESVVGGPLEDMKLSYGLKINIKIA